jgi:hypothetical protein
MRQTGRAACTNSDGCSTRPRLYEHPINTQPVTGNKWSHDWFPLGQTGCTMSGDGQRQAVASWAGG